MDKARLKVIACATVVEEMLPLLPPDVPYEVLDFGLHVRPINLKGALQEAIDRSAAEADTILLGYGLCSLAVIGLRANGCRLVIPRADDCITLFLGSSEAYHQQAHTEPGTYYLTKGWIEVGDTPFNQHERMIAKYGEEKAQRMIGLLLKNYHRLVYINTGRQESERYRDYARRTADKFGLRFEEITGSPGLVTRLIFGPWGEEFVVVEPGGETRYQDFASPEPLALHQ